MKVVLLQDVKKVGVRGSVADVADGYANNVLIPRRLAVAATSENLKRLEREREGEKEKRKLDGALAAEALAGIDGKSVSIQTRANPSGGLFEAIRAKQVAEAIRRELGVAVPEEAVMPLPEAIKKLGEYRAQLAIGGASAEISVVVSKLEP